MEIRKGNYKMTCQITHTTNIKKNHVSTQAENEGITRGITIRSQAEQTEIVFIQVEDALGVTWLMLEMADTHMILDEKPCECIKRNTLIERCCGTLHRHKLDASCQRTTWTILQQKAFSKNWNVILKQVHKLYSETSISRNLLSVASF